MAAIGIALHELNYPNFITMPGRSHGQPESSSGFPLAITVINLEQFIHLISDFSPSSISVYISLPIAQPSSKRAVVIKLFTLMPVNMKGSTKLMSLM